MEAIIANAVQPERQEPAPVIEAAAVAPGPSIPSNADVARAATQARPRKAKKPTTSVTVVTKAPEASAGSIAQPVQHHGDHRSRPAPRPQVDHHRRRDHRAQHPASRTRSPHDAHHHREDRSR
jgi:arylamine N-acetyltransferase